MTDTLTTIPTSTNEPIYYQTKRPTVAALEAILGDAIPVLDCGFIRIIDYMGDDSAVVQAARVSYGKGTTKVNADKALIAYLMRHNHTTPFEMCEIKLHIKAPIFVARQWMRHRAASINEYSARYSIVKDEFYMPAVEHLATQSKQDKQCRENKNQLSPAEAKEVLALLHNDAARCYTSYMTMLNIDEHSGDTLDPERLGLARELARINLNLSYYTQWYWKINLHNLMHFLKLRSHHHAQYEIRAYADKLLEVLELWVPQTNEAFRNYKVNGESLSANALAIIQQMLRGEKVDFATSGMSRREWNDMCSILGLAEMRQEQ